MPAGATAAGGKSVWVAMGIQRLEATIPPGLRVKVQTERVA